MIVGIKYWCRELTFWRLATLTSPTTPTSLKISSNLTSSCQFTNCKISCPKFGKMADQNHFSVFKTVFYYSIFIILAPITTFFFTKILFFENILGTSNVTSNVWSAVAAVVILHVALGLYIYKAYSESGKVKLDKDDKVD